MGKIINCVGAVKYDFRAGNLKVRYYDTLVAVLAPY
jgi:hypothetical protein